MLSYAYIFNLDVILCVSSYVGFMHVYFQNVHVKSCIYFITRIFALNLVECCCNISIGYTYSSGDFSNDETRHRERE